MKTLAMLCDTLARKLTRLSGALKYARLMPPDYPPPPPPPFPPGLESDGEVE